MNLFYNSSALEQSINPAMKEPNLSDKWRLNAQKTNIRDMSEGSQKAPSMEKYYPQVKKSKGRKKTPKEHVDEIIKEYNREYACYL